MAKDELTAATMYSRAYCTSTTGLYTPCCSGDSFCKSSLACRCMSLGQNMVNSRTDVALVKLRQRPRLAASAATLAAVLDLWLERRCGLAASAAPLAAVSRGRFGFRERH